MRRAEAMAFALYAAAACAALLGGFLLPVEVARWLNAKRRRPA